VDDVCFRLGLERVRTLDADTNSTFLLASSDYVDPGVVLEWLKLEEDIFEAEPVLTLAMTEPLLDPGLDQSTVCLLNGLGDTQLVDYFGSSVLRGYSNQPAASTIRLHRARRDYAVEGSHIVAILDTGVDPNHPALSSALIPGFDFTRDLPGIPDEKSDLDQSTVGLLNQSTVGLLNAALAEPRYSAFGHGTMVAGIVRLVAPGAQIMALKVFRSDGTASADDIVQAVYYAVDNGASVINMSFSMQDFSPALLRAVNHATLKGVVCVASVGNRGDSALAYPASLGNVIGVASTTYLDKRASFSSFGANSVRLAAPGEGIITTYPGGIYAAAWGTSFSVPLVSGAAALLIHAGELWEQELAAISAGTVASAGGARWSSSAGSSSAAPPSTSPTPSTLFSAAVEYGVLPHIKVRFVAPVIAEALSYGEDLLDSSLGHGRLDVRKAVKALRKRLLIHTN
jgi:subtilisin family serine protease